MESNCSLDRDSSRRTFLKASVGACSAATIGALNAPSDVSASSTTAKAKTTILFFLCGGASHIDTWDMKPDAPVEYRGPFNPIQTSASDVRLSEHLPMTAKVAHHLAVVNSIDGAVNTNDHHGGYYHNLTGHRPDQSFRTEGNNRTPYPDDWPYMGSVVAMKRVQQGALPNAITLPHKPSVAPFTRPGQFAGRLGVEFDPMYVIGEDDNPTEFRAPALALQGDLTVDRLTNRKQLLDVIDRSKRDFESFRRVNKFTREQKRAVELLTAAGTTEAFDVASEPEEVKERYGKTINGMSMLLARRLAEREIPFVTVFWRENTKLNKKCNSAGGWDTHGNNFTCLKENLLPEFDRVYSALIEDLHQRGMLDQTVVLVTSEMGRKPKIGDPRSGGASGQGRDHWTYCLTDLLAGGGIRGGITYGSTDRLGGYPADLVVTPADITKTVYHCMGIDDLTATDESGRVYNLIEEGRTIDAII